MPVGVLFILQAFAEQRNFPQIQSRSLAGNFISVDYVAADRNFIAAATTRNI
jgi:hypothetical protein